jgi:hypothetical protein
MLTAMVWTFLLLYAGKYLTRSARTRRRRVRYHVTTTSPSYA